MRITPLEAWTSAAVAALGVAALALAVAYLWHTRRDNRGPGRHVLGRPRFDGDPGGWPQAGPAATLNVAPLADVAFHIDWATAPPPDMSGQHPDTAGQPDMAETHADMYGVPTPRYTELDAWRAEEEAAERLAGTATRYMVVSIIRGLEYRDTVDVTAALILERAYATLALVDIRMGLS